MVTAQDRSREERERNERRKAPAKSKPIQVPRVVEEND